MEKTLLSRTTLLSLLVICIGFIFYLKGCFGGKSDPKDYAQPIEMTFYFKTNPTSREISALEKFLLANNGIIFLDSNSIANSTKSTKIINSFAPLQAQPKDSKTRKTTQISIEENPCLGRPSECIFMLVVPVKVKTPEAMGYLKSIALSEINKFNQNVKYAKITFGKDFTR